MIVSKHSEEDNLHDVMEELASFDRTCYYDFGTSLRLTTSELDSIESTYQEYPKRALRKVVTAWLQKHYNVDKFGPPTWQMLVKGVHSPAGGNDYTLAKKIADNHPASEWIVIKSNIIHVLLIQLFIIPIHSIMDKFKWVKIPRKCECHIAT